MRESCTLKSPNQTSAPNPNQLSKPGMDGDGDKDLEEVHKILRDVWADFTASFDARDLRVINEAYSKRIISKTTRDKIMQAKDSLEATSCFLIHLENSATIDTLWKVHAMLQKTSEDHDSHQHLCEVLSCRLGSKRKVSIATVKHVYTAYRP